VRGLHWFRNDLRLEDNLSLNSLLETVEEWAAVFVADPKLVSGPGASSKRLCFLADSLKRLSEQLGERDVPLVFLSGDPEQQLPRLMDQLHASVLSYNESITPFGRKRDGRVAVAVERDGGRIISERDHVVFSASDIRTAKGTAYAVYTPYRNAWWRRFKDVGPEPRRVNSWPKPIAKLEASDHDVFSGLEDLTEGIPDGGAIAAHERLRSFLETGVENYETDRDRPDMDGTSRLSPYLRFGCISVRECFYQAIEASLTEPSLRAGSTKWLDELIWREFYSAVLEENPRVLRGNYRSEFDSLSWRSSAMEFEAWCAGQTGYPIVDAGMRQLKETGWMHNRVRMVVASFLTKDLLMDWREGERFFFEHLIDGDPASNNGGWQWAASTGTDAQPFFRIFNPTRQGERWDPNGEYVRRWVPELRDLPDRGIQNPAAFERISRDYPLQIVDHSERRVAALEMYRKARQSHREN
jgi:deoxyribodipyrimidine photo-lyase